MLSLSTVLGIGTLLVILSFSTFLQQCPTECCTFQNGLNQMILLEGFGEIFVHLSLYTFFSVAKHSMCRKSDNGRSLGSEAAFVFTDFGGCFKSSLVQS